jgi:hypothetical protein
MPHNGQAPSAFGPLVGLPAGRLPPVETRAVIGHFQDQMISLKPQGKGNHFSCVPTGSMPDGIDQGLPQKQLDGETLLLETRSFHPFQGFPGYILHPVNFCLKLVLPL